MTHTVGIIGSGAMGSGIAQVASTAGNTVLIYDNNAAALEKSKANMQSLISALVGKGKLSEANGNGILERMHYVAELNELANCDIIIEAIVENLEVKQKVFSDIEKSVKKDCVLATNTSSLSVASIASACSISKRVIGIHFFNPAPLMPLVEIIPSILTDKSIADHCKQLITSWNKTVVMAKDTPGFIVNRVARSFYGESIRIYEEGIADMPTIDWALKEFGGFRMGPFELMDFIGNDVNYKVTESVWEQFFYDPRFKPSITQKRLYEAKLFGRKSGKGYYSYGENVSLPEPVKDHNLGKKIFERVIAMLINEAVDSLYLQLATKEDIETAMTKGVNYPKGLLKWCDELGPDSVYETLSNLYREYSEERYRPCVLLKKHATQNLNFFNS